METGTSTAFAGNSNRNEGTIVYQTADVEKLIREKQQLILCAEELELEASRNHRVLTEELRALKTANKELKDKYEFSESHYQMTLRHANNLQSFLDARDQELARLHSEMQELQGQLHIRNVELAQARARGEELQNQQEVRMAELLQTREQLDNANRQLENVNMQLDHTNMQLNNANGQLASANQRLEQQADELMQTHRHANNLQSMLDAQTEALKKMKLVRIRERIRGWFR